jgi:hypothetical protein
MTSTTSEQLQGRYRSKSHQRLAEANAAAKAAAPAPLYCNYLHFAGLYRNVYHGMRPGGARRKALLQIFQQHPQGQLPVNNKYQANTVDSDLATLLKQGLIRQVRGGGGKRHPLNRSSNKRQTYLVLA